SDLAEDLERSTYDSAEWYDAVQLTDDDAATLKHYEDLVWERVRQLRDASAAVPPEQGVRELSEALDQRRDLLVPGRRAPAPRRAPVSPVARGLPGGGPGCLTRAHSW